VATISRMLKNIGLFCKRALQKRPVFCNETYIFKHPTNRSHPISDVPLNLGTGWRRLTGSLIFIRHFFFFHRCDLYLVALLWENDLQLKGSYESSPPCVSHDMCESS